MNKNLSSGQLYDAIVGGDESIMYENFSSQQLYNIIDAKIGDDIDEIPLSLHKIITPKNLKECVSKYEEIGYMTFLNIKASKFYVGGQTELRNDIIKEYLFFNDPTKFREDFVNSFCLKEFKALGI